MVSRRKRIHVLKQGPVKPLLDVDPAQYREWIAYVFDRPTTPNGWYFDMDPRPLGFEASPGEIVSLIANTMARSGTDLTEFSNAQVRHGLNYIFSYACSNHSSVFSNATIPLDQRIVAISAMTHLYKDCFEPRCDSCLGHLNEGSNNPLNMIAYMLWDITPIFHGSYHLPGVDTAIVDVQDFALRSSNIACVESALHGLGHERQYRPLLVDPVIDRFLATTIDLDLSPRKRRVAPGLRPIRGELRDYARYARLGRIQ